MWWIIGHLIPDKVNLALGRLQAIYDKCNRAMRIEMLSPTRTFSVLAFLTGWIILAAPVLAAGSDVDENLTSAVTAIEKKDYAGAIEYLKEVLDEEGRNADALNYMGYSYRKLGNYERAIKFYLAALDVNPRHKGANEYIGEAYLELKQPAKAKTYLDRLAKICGPSCEEYRDLKAAFDAYRVAGKQS